MKTNQYPSQSELKALFDYNPDTGVLTWKKPKTNRVKIGDVASTLNSHGYLKVGIGKNQYQVHRIIWIMNYGNILDNYFIDHINCIKSDNKKAIIISLHCETDFVAKNEDFVTLVEKLADKAIRVVSMPCAEVFLQQEQSYQDTVLPQHIDKRMAIEAGVTNYWYQFVGRSGKVIGIDRFGESAPAKILFKEFGFTVENVIQHINEME